MRRSDLDGDPLRQFRRWLAEARLSEPRLPEAMVVVTASAAARPSARFVLLKGLDERGFVFYSDYESRKGRELAENAVAALLFYWCELGRQVRVEGRVERTSAEESDAYFKTRPLASRISTLASRQSSVIGSRDELEAAVADVRRALAGAEPARPERWGGYRVVPDTYEFWEHRDDRLHDRFRYRRGGGGAWIVERLRP